VTHSGVLLQPLVRPRKRSDYPATALAADKTPALAEKAVMTARSQFSTLHRAQHAK